MRTLCRGWGCSVPNNDTQHYELLNKLHSDYRSGKLNESLPLSLSPYVSLRLPPALAASSAVHLFGLGGAPKDLRLSYSLLRSPECSDSWVCREMLALHPLTPDSERSAHLSRAADLGSLLGAKLRADRLCSSGQRTECVRILRHIATASSTSWMRKKRGGLRFASAIRSLLTRRSSASWATLRSLARAGHLPSVLWLADAYLRGISAASVDYDELVPQLLRVCRDATWRLDASEALTTRDTSFDRTEFLRYISRVDDTVAPAALSYPALFR